MALVHLTASKNDSSAFQQCCRSRKYSPHVRIICIPDMQLRILKRKIRTFFQEAQFFLVLLFHLYILYIFLAVQKSIEIKNGYSLFYMSWYYIKMVLIFIYLNRLSQVKELTFQLFISNSPKFSAISLPIFRVWHISSTHLCLQKEFEFLRKSFQRNGFLV